MGRASSPAESGNNRLSLTRSIVVVALAALAAAGAVALSSRAPGSLRALRPAAADFDPDLGDRFSEQQRERADAYRRPGYVSLAAGLAVQLMALLLVGRAVLMKLGPGAESQGLGYFFRAAWAGLLVAVVLFLAGIPVAFVRGYVIEHAWGLSTQGVGGWTSDLARSLLVSVVVTGVTAGVFFSLVRWRPSGWWVWGWAAFTILTVVMAYVWPLVVAPLFNRFTPLQDEGLAASIRDLASEAGVGIDSVLVADASRRTTAENAYVAGIGSSKRVVLYDTLLEGEDPQTLFVVAHEFGHERKNHILWSLALAFVGLGFGFGALRLFQDSSLWSWTGASGLGDVRAMPLLAAFALVASLVTAPASNWVSRRFERQADSFAVELTGDPAAAVAAFRRLALNNLSDIDPPRPVVWLLYTHPPIAERIRALVP